MSYKKVTAIRDDSGHWYLIPDGKEEKFYELLEKDDDYGEAFEAEFSKYRTGGDLNLKQLYIKQDD